MKAIGIEEHGGPEKLRAVEVPRPEVGENDLLVEVYASAVNPVDFKIREGYIGKDRPKPMVLGYDVSGMVVEAGAKVEGFKVGDAVYASPSLMRQGANAEYVAVDFRTAGPKPQNLSHPEAAALPLVTLTAWQSLHEHGRLHTDETVLIQAGGGGVGHIAIQLAKVHGSRVITTASRDDSIALCRELGADVIVNYKQEEVVERVMAETDGRGCAVTYDTAGGEAFVQAMRCAAVNGRVVTIVGVPDDADVNELKMRNASVHLAFMGAATVHGVHPERQGQTLRTVTELVEAGKLRPHIGHVFALDDLAEAHAQQESGHTTGKIVIAVR